VIPVSSLHGSGISELIQDVVSLLPEGTAPEEESEEIRLTILGRPNVGKSSLLNAFAGEQRAIVSTLPGTTRDALDTLVEYRGKSFRIVDTAGLRRRGKIQGTIEYYMADRAVRALSRSHCGLVVIDAKEGITDGDKRVAKKVHDAGKALVLVANKWALVERAAERGRLTPEQKAFAADVLAELPETAYASVCFTSATHSSGLERALDAVVHASESHGFRIATGPLNRLIQDAVFARPHSSKGKALRIYYATQLGTHPPTFALFCNDPGILHFSYLRYLENQLRKKHPLKGTPVRWVVRSSHEGRD
jgi:GTP-binding protein